MTAIAMTPATFSGHEGRALMTRDQRVIDPRNLPGALCVSESRSGLTQEWLIPEPRGAWLIRAIPRLHGAIVVALREGVAAHIEGHPAEDWRVKKVYTAASVQELAERVKERPARSWAEVWAGLELAVAGERTIARQRRDVITSRLTLERAREAKPVPVAPSLASKTLAGLPTAKVVQAPCGGYTIYPLPWGYLILNPRRWEWSFTPSVWMAADEAAIVWGCELDPAWRRVVENLRSRLDFGGSPVGVRKDPDRKGRWLVYIDRAAAPTEGQARKMAKLAVDRPVYKLAGRLASINEIRELTSSRPSSRRIKRWLEEEWYLLVEEVQ